MKTKLVGSKDLTSKAFASVDDPNDPGTWSFPISDAVLTRTSLHDLLKGHMDADKRAAVAKKVLAAAKRFGLTDDAKLAPVIEGVKELVQKQLKVAEADMSFDDIQCELQDALMNKFGADASMSPSYVLVTAYPDYLIARGPGGKLWKMVYSINQQGDAALGAPQEVEAGFVPLAQEQSALVGEAAALTWTARRIKNDKGRTRGMRIISGLDSQDKIQLAMDRTLGVREAQSSGIRPFRGIQEVYMVCTGDKDLSQLGKGGFQLTSESIATTDFPNILLDSMEKKLIQDYAEIGLNGMEQLITKGPALKDYRVQSRVREGYMADLPIVAEAGPYTELNKPTDEKVTYAAQKRGGVLTISEETIRADDLDKIKDFPNRMARAARHTLKSFVTNFFINNPNYGADGISWFNVSHGNLFANPLNIDTLIAQEILQMKQTEKDSGNKLEKRISWLMVPVDLGPAAWQINNAQFYNPGQGIQQPNPFYLRFGPAGTGRMSPPGIIINGLLADTNDWYYGVDNIEVPILEVGYMDGIETPQILMADLSTQGTQFTNDQIQYKVKFPFGGTMLDFRGVGKNAVP
ncbi:MAG: hypothetical protein ACJ71W_16615 [Terriglobales bacterium]